MRNEQANIEFKQVQWKGVGFARKWQAKRTEVSRIIDCGVKNSLKAFEESKKSNHAIVGQRPD